MPTIKKNVIQDLSHLDAFLACRERNNQTTQVFNIQKHAGEGHVRSIQLSDGLLALHFEVLLGEDIKLGIDSDEMDVVHFLYCLKGNCSHSFAGETSMTGIDEKRTAVIYSGSGSSSQVHMKKDEPLTFHLIRMKKEWYRTNIGFEKTNVKAPLYNFFKSLTPGAHSFHLGQFNFEIGELVQKLGNSKYPNEVYELSNFKGLCHIILAHQIKQFCSQTYEVGQPKTTLLKRELLHIVELTDFVKNYPEVLHSVTSLCSKCGLSAAKLQEGFKFLHQQTVGEFIRDVRLKRAEFLLRTSEMNISEVVYSIGFTSRSYFCKIFKGKYGCSPKKYKNHAIRNLQLMA